MRALITIVSGNLGRASTHLHSVITVLFFVVILVLFFFLLFLCHLCQLEWIDGNDLKITSTLAAGHDIALIDLAFFDIQIAFAFGTKNHCFPPRNFAEFPYASGDSPSVVLESYLTQ